MSAADLLRLVQRATPRTEDVRSPDRTDFVRREHGHLTLREVADALDALGFAADCFVERMRSAVAADGPASGETAVHGLFRALQGLQSLEPALPPAQPEVPAPAEAPAAEAAAGWQAAVAEARAAGAECFGRGDFAGAAEHYAAAIRAAQRGHDGLSALHSNRSAALLRLGKAPAALAEARQCLELAPAWPKARFREGCCLRQLGLLGEAVHAFGEGRVLDPGNGDWATEIERTERLRWAQPSTLVRQLLMRLLPEMLGAWSRGGDASGVLQLQVNADLKDIGTPKWRLLQEGRSDAKAQVRYAFLSRKGYLANLAANLQDPPGEAVAVVDLEGRPLKLAQIISFLPGDGVADPGSRHASLHIDVRAETGKMAAVICRVPCDEGVGCYLAPQRDPAPPKGSVEGVLQIQRQSGFPKALPRLLGFQSLPGDLNFPVIDLERDAPGAGMAS